MKLPVPDEVLERLDRAEQNMVALRQSMERIEDLLSELIAVTYAVNGVDRSPDL